MPLTKLLIQQDIHQLKTFLTNTLPRSEVSAKLTHSIGPTDSIAELTQYPPTKVHLLSFDGGCHVLPTLAFATPAKCQLIATFHCVHNLFG